MSGSALPTARRQSGSTVTGYITPERKNDSDPLTIAQQVSDAAKAYLAWVKDSATAPLGFINGVARPIILMAKYLPQRLVTTNVGALSGGKKTTKDDDGNPQEEDRTTAAISGTGSPAEARRFTSSARVSGSRILGSF